MHVGNLRTALYAYLLARSNDGDFLLRIEDTDQDREVVGALDVIYNTLRVTGLTYDEGPGVGGAYGPYIQSQRLDIYLKYALELIDRHGAYYCFCSKERLDQLRLMQEASRLPPKYDGHCRSLPKEEVAARLSSGEPYVVRQRIPDGGTTAFEDVVFGRIVAPNDALDDNVLLKSDGMPTYNFANVVDDHLMEISHVLRGTEYLSSAPKYNLLYNSFGWDIPIYVHCPPVMRDSSKKLSKRLGDPSFEDLLAEGYLKDAILNYIALLGWSPGGEREMFSLEELVEAFSLDGISKSPSIFDVAKLRWLNGEYIRAQAYSTFEELLKPWLDRAVTRTDVNKALLTELIHTRCERMSDVIEQLDFVDNLPDYPVELYSNAKMKTDSATALTALRAVHSALGGLSEWNKDALHDTLGALASEMGVKNSVVLWPLRVAVSGKSFTPGGGIELSAALGKEETLARILIGISKLEA